MNARSANQARQVVVTGVGAVTPLGVGADALHHRAVTGASGVEDGVGRCSTFRPSDHLTPREVRRMDRFAQLAVVAAIEAAAQARWDEAPPSRPERVQCFIGTAIGGLETIEAQLAASRTDNGAISPLTVPLLMANAAAAQLCMRLKIHGESAALSTACSSGAQAIVAGTRSIALGDADVAVVGGAESILTEFAVGMFQAAGAISPSGQSTPFSNDRDGFVLGEGAGVLVLEARESARERGAAVLAEVAGYGCTSDAFHLTAPEPDATYASVAIRTALSMAACRPEDIAFINAHGTGTHLNDATEARALREALGPAVTRVPLASTKSCIGHLMGAAGAVEAIATIEALRHAVAPPTVGLKVPDPILGDLDHLTEPRQLVANAEGELVALSNSMGFGGHNVALLFRREGHQAEGTSHAEGKQ